MIRLTKENLKSIQEEYSEELHRRDRVVQISNYKTFINHVRNDLRYSGFYHGSRYNGAELILNIFDKYPQLIRSLKRRGFTVDFQYEYGKTIELYIS